MKKVTLVAALLLATVSPSLAQQPAPQAAQPTITQKAGDVAGQVLNKLSTQGTPAASATPSAAVAAKPAAVAPKVALVNINKASPSELDALPSIGEARTKAIIAGRPYKAVQDLLDRKILPKDAYEAIREKVAVK